MFRMLIPSWLISLCFSFLYLYSVDRAFFVGHIDTALEDAGGNLGATREVQALFQQYYLERGPIASASFSSGALVASSNVFAAATSKQAFGSSRSPSWCLSLLSLFSMLGEGFFQS